jgi:hypothetical protein
MKLNKVFYAIILYFIIYGLIFYSKPAIFFNLDGSLLQFGVGYKNKTIMPLWLFAIFSGILSYLLILYFVYYTIRYV